MAGLLLELRRQIRNKHRKNANSNGQKKSQAVHQRTSPSHNTSDVGKPTEVPEPAETKEAADTVKETEPAEALFRYTDFGDAAALSEDGGMGAGDMSEEASPSMPDFFPDVRWLMHIYERNLSIVSKDDILLKQIDEFRERAQQLQDMLDSRETQAEELRTLVDERQVKAEELGQILKERQDKADGLTAAVERQIDAMIEKVGVRLEQIEASIRGDVGTKVEQLEASVKNDVGAKLDRLETSMSSDVGAKIDRLEASMVTLRNDVGAKMDRFGSMMGNNDVSARMDQLEISVKETLNEGNRMSLELTRQQSAQQLQEMKDALEQIQQQLTTAKGELSDKVHSETVKCYRNVQELYKGMDDRLEKINQINDVEETVKGTKNFGVLSVVLSVVSLVGILGLLLMNMGLF
ncbi:MAG: hypothetical protein NC355_01605 [Blautia sp.]|nr:hypothetical protein [Blautia sp.]